MAEQQTHQAAAIATEDDDRKRRRGAVAAYRWWERFGWLRWLFGRGGENAGLLFATAAIVGVAGWTAIDMVEARYRTKYLRSVAQAERLSPSTVAYLIEGTDSNGRRAVFDLIVANKSFTWRHGATDQLEQDGRPLKREDVGTIIIDDLVRARLRSAKELIAVGTASQEGEPTQELVRAGKRAEQTAQWLQPALGGDTPIWTLNLGQYQVPCESCETNETNWQRPFLIVAVREAAWGVDIGEALADALAGSSNLPSPDRYSAFGLSRFR